MVDVFLELDSTDTSTVTDEIAATALLDRFQPSLAKIGMRRKQIPRIGIAYDTPSVALYNQANDLYSLGYFFSCVVVCRTAVERLAFEIFFEEVEIEGKKELIETLAESLDFRKILDGFLYNKDKGYKIISKKEHGLFHELYTLGNKWIHPKKPPIGVKIENEALKSMMILGALFSSLRDVMKDYDIKEGGLVQKPEARKKVRPIVFDPKD